MADQKLKLRGLGQKSTTDEPRDYLQATGPRPWMIMSVVIALIAGLAALSIATTMQNTVHTVANVAFVEDEEGNSGYLISLEIPKTAESAVDSGTPVTVAGVPGKLHSIYVDEEDGSWGSVFLDRRADLPDGTYDATILLEEVTPFSFIESDN